MTSLFPLISANSIALIIALCFLIPPSYSSSPRDLAVEEKARVGSTPPSCHSKCNLCHPCTAVQVPTMPSGHHRVDPSSLKEDAPYSDDSLSAGNIFSSYKPLKWNCRCAGQFYNP